MAEALSHFMGLRLLRRAGAAVLRGIEFLLGVGILVPTAFWLLVVCLVCEIEERQITGSWTGRGLPLDSADPPGKGATVSGKPQLPSFPTRLDE